MDSGNSDSSSCGEDQEYDSRAAAYTFSPFTNHPPPPFDPFSNFLHPQNQNPSPLLNTNFLWPRNTNLTPDPRLGNTTTPPSTADVSGNNPTGAPPASAADNGGQNRTPAPRNTKKRSRASRRAPTTVLTTDTSNFRAMVQEFTGIPAPPFTSASPFQRSRLDLYGAPSSMRLKPHDAAHHLPFLASNASILSSSTKNAASASTPFNYQSLSAQSSNLFNLISNQSLGSVLRTEHMFPFSSSSVLASKFHGSFENPSSDQLHSNMKSLHFDEFSLRHDASATLASIPNLVSSDRIQQRNDLDNNGKDMINNSNNPDEIHHDGAEIIRSGSNFSRNPKNGKMGHSANSTADFHGEKEQGNMGTRSSEGMMESWICSSELK